MQTVSYKGSAYEENGLNTAKFHNIKKYVMTNYDQKLLKWNVAFIEHFNSELKKEYNFYFLKELYIKIWGFSKIENTDADVKQFFSIYS